MSQEIRIGWDFIPLAAVPVPNVMSLWLSLMAGSILMRGHPSLADELVAWLTSWWPWADARRRATTPKCRIKHPAERKSAAAPALRCLARPFCAFFYYQLVHCILFMKLHGCMCSGGDFFCLLINLGVQRTWIVVDNNISWQSYDY